jgi:DNA-directed RNA polymerase specialized sigma24 family protein
MKYDFDPSGGAPIVVATPAEIDALRPRLARIAAQQRVPDRDVPDVVQDAVIVLWTAVEGRRIRGSANRSPEAAFTAYAYGVVRYLVGNRKQLKRNRCEVFVLDLVPDREGSDPFGQIEARAELRRISRKRGRTMEALLLRALGLTGKEGAASVGIPSKTFFARVRLARERLRPHEPTQPTPHRPRDRKKGR